ncbi:MAG TPA: hypothetical protein VIL30_09115 [Ramlibacter sp.]|jgi:predicted negative regulator of RcsB-dependent stress response
MTTRNLLIILIAAVLVVGGFVAYQTYQRDQNTLDMSVGPNGISVD